MKAKILLAVSLVFFGLFLIGSACISFGLYYGWYAKILWEMKIYGIVSPSRFPDFHCTASSFDVKSVAMIQTCTMENIAYTSFAYFCIGAITLFFFGYARARDILRAIIIGVGGTSGFLLLFTILLYNGERVYWFQSVTQLQVGILQITNAELFVISLAIFSLSLLLIIAIHTKFISRLARAPGT